MYNKLTKRPRKLSVDREILRSLSAHELRAAAGAMIESAPCESVQAGKCHTALC